MSAKCASSIDTFSRGMFLVAIIFPFVSIISSLAKVNVRSIGLIFQTLKILLSLQRALSFNLK